jgi:hypothetical protein
MKKIPVHGSTLFITLIVAIFVFSLIAVATERMMGNHRLQKHEHYVANAQFAAESAVGLLEHELLALLEEDPANLQNNIDTSDAKNWLSGKGFDMDGNATDALYLSGCAVRWRVEPVKIMETASTAADNKEKQFFVNSERNASLYDDRKAGAETAAAGTAGGGTNKLLIDPAQHFFFRIVAEAYALKDPRAYTHATVSSPAPAMPWATSGAYHVRVQVQRVIKLEDQNAYRYLFNYTTANEDGDLEFYPESTVTLSAQAPFHSNNAIFFGSKNPSAVIQIGKPTTKDADNNDVTSDDVSAIEAARGIFRLSKVDEYKNYVPVALEVPDMTTSTTLLPANKIKLNNITFNVDSRAKIGNAKIPPDGTVYVKDGLDNEDHESVARDGIHRQMKVIPLKNASEDFPETIKYGKGGSIWSDGNGVYSMVKKRTPLHERFDDSTTYSMAGVPIFSHPKDFGDPEAGTEDDIWPLAPNVNNKNGFDGNGTGARYSDNPYVLLMRPDGVPHWTEDPINQEEEEDEIVKTAKPDDYSRIDDEEEETALIIRERYRSQPLGVARPVVNTKSTLTAAQATAFNNYMKANYVVYLGRTEDGSDLELNDITEDFFDAAPAGGINKVTDFLAHEDTFTNQRDQAWLQLNNGITDPITTNVLTINTNAILRFINDNGLDQYFNGYIYVERAHRRFTIGAAGAATAHPLAPFGYSPFIDHNNIAGTFPSGFGKGLMAETYFKPVVGFPGRGVVPGTPVGADGSWLVFPSNKGVRVRNAEILERKIQICTPNALYIWGDFNKDKQMVGVAADTIHLLSNSWDDTKGSDPLATIPKPVATTVTGAFITRNVPTDLSNAKHGGSGGAQNLIRFLEDWSGVQFTFVGGFVVPGRAKQCYTPINLQNPINLIVTEYHKEPNYSYTYDLTLLTSDQPYYDLKTTGATRILGGVTIGDF